MTKYNVVYDKQKDFSVLQSQLEALGVVIHNVFSSIGVLTISSNSTEFSQIDGILTFEEDLVVVPIESFEWHQLRVASRSLPMTNYYKVTNFGDGVNVYVVDSGIDGSHSEFSHTTINNLFSYNSDFTPTNGHGTAVASVIGGNTLGISKNVKLHSVKIPTGAETTYSVLLSAFDAILNHHDASSVAIVNCSWTVPKSQILDLKITELQNDNLVVVAAAGNTGVAANDFSPVGLNSVLGVGASDAYDRVISWGGSSNWGPEVDLFAPGIDVVVAEMGATTMEVSGTSIAAGVVSGVVAQYIVESPTSTASQIQSLVIQQAMEDLLFRNESIYGTTPNRIVAASILLSVFKNIPEKLDVQRGTSVQFTPEYNSLYASSVQFNYITQTDSKRIELPEWITAENNTLTISPPTDLLPAKYMIPMRAVNDTNSPVEMQPLYINVYENDPNENEIAETYRYLGETADSPVVVKQAFCGSYTCFGSFQPCYSGKNEAPFPCSCGYNALCGSFGS
jgi:subtilisin family serine protease